MEPENLQQKEVYGRRNFLKGLIAGAGAFFLTSSVIYPFAEAQLCRVTRYRLNLKNLPFEFTGTRIVFLSDLHLGPTVSLDYLRRVVQITRGLTPHLVALGGDYIFKSASYIWALSNLLKDIKAPLGVYGVLGNHDYANDVTSVRSALRKAQIQDLTNTGVWLSKGGRRIRLCGVDDFWLGDPDADAALADATDTDAVFMLCHNPDFFETLNDPRVTLSLSGHTHGGQIRIPGLGAPVIPSQYGQKYAYGLIQAPRTQVLVTSGIGTIIVPARFCCPPEVVAIELHSLQGDPFFANQQVSLSNGVNYG